MKEKLLLFIGIVVTLTSCSWFSEKDPAYYEYFSIEDFGTEITDTIILNFSQPFVSDKNITYMVSDQGVRCGTYLCEVKKETSQRFEDLHRVLGDSIQLFYNKKLIATWYYDAEPYIDPCDTLFDWDQTGNIYNLKAWSFHTGVQRHRQASGFGIYIKTPPLDTLKIMHRE